MDEKQHMFRVREPAAVRIRRESTHKMQPNHRDADSHGTIVITRPRCSAKYGRSFAGEFLRYILETWLILSIKITDHLRNYYK